MIIRASSTATDVLERAARRFTGLTTGSASFVQSPGTIAFIAVDDHEVQGWCWGYLLVRPDGTNMLYLHNLEVAETCRRRGIGRALLRSFMEAGAQLGAAKMFLITGAGNVAARRLYESMGAGLATQGPTVNYWFPLPQSPLATGGASPSGASPSGASPSGASPNGASPNGTGPDGTPPNGTGPDGTPPDGTGPDGTSPSRTPQSE